MSIELVTTSQLSVKKHFSLELRVVRGAPQNESYGAMYDQAIEDIAKNAPEEANAMINVKTQFFLDERNTICLSLTCDVVELHKQ